MPDEFDLPDFIESEEPKDDEFFEGQPPNSMPDGVVFVFQSQGAPVLPSGESESPSYESLTEEELLGIYITTNAMMNILIEKGIITRSQLSKKVQEIKKAYLNSKKK